MLSGNDWLREPILLTPDNSPCFCGPLFDHVSNKGDAQDSQSGLRGHLSARSSNMPSQFRLTTCSEYLF